MKIMITGATGFIGSRLARCCIDNETDVVGFSLINSDWERRRADELQALGVAMCIGSVLDYTLAREACDDVDAVVHLAAAQHETKGDFEYFRNINVEGTRNILDACIDAGVRRFVYGSTIGVYGGDVGEPLTEFSPLNPQNHYALSKVMAEHLIGKFEGQINYSVARISETYGPEDARLYKLFKGVASGWFPVIGDCKNMHQPVFVDDLAHCLYEIATRCDLDGRTFVLAGPQPISTDEMIHIVEDALHHRNHCPHIPLAPLIGTAVVLEKVCPLVGLSPPLTRRRLDFFRTSFSFDMGKAQNLLRAVPSTPFELGARMTSDWYRQHGLLPVSQPL